jgi:tetratricopeptide (TPR) repeat protein
MKRFSTLLLSLVLGSFSLVHAQGGNFNWPAGKESAAMEKWTLMSDDVKNNNFKGARPHFVWLLQNAPNVNQGLYIKGGQIYEALANTPGTDPKRVMGLQDTLLMIHDLRIQHFNDEANVLNRKGLYAYPFLITRNPAPLEQMHAMYARILELNPTSTLFPSNALSYMDLMCRQKNAGKLTDQQILEGYDKIDQAYNANISKGNQVEAWNQVKADIDRLLASCVTIDCQFVKNNMGPQYRANPQDLNMAKKIASHMITGKCTDDPLFMEVANHISSAEPSYAWEVMLAQKEIASKNLDGAIQHYQKAAELGETNAKKAEAHMNIGNIHSSRGQKESARAAYRRAIAADNSFRDAYTAIGDLYYNSRDCAGGNALEQRLFYIAAYEMYERGGASSKMNAAKSQFPSKQEAFTLGKSAGTSMNTGCWINENVSLRFRD